jgi:hypothetical protein
MESIRKTGQDYRKEMIDLQKSLESLDVHVTERLIELAKIHPEAIIVKKSCDEYKAKCLTKNWVEGLSMESRIKYIENIEKWSAELQKVQQLKIE